MIEIKSIKEKFNDKWWSLLGHHFEQPYMEQIYSTIMSDFKKGYKVLPSSNDIYQRFKLINPEDVRIVFLTEFPIGSYQQSLEWRNISSMIEKECFDGLHLNVEENLNYLIPFGVINLSPSLTVCNKSDHSNIGWNKLVEDIIKILMKTDNNILFVLSSDILSELYLEDMKLDYKFDYIKLEDGCFTKINEWMQKEYNTKINY